MNGDEIQRRLASESVGLHRELAPDVSEQSCEHLKKPGGNGSQPVKNPDEITSEDLIRYVEGSLTTDRDRYNRVEEAISKDSDLFDEYIELCEQIWTRRVLNPAAFQTYTGGRIGHPRDEKGADPVGDVEGPVSVTTEDLIRYVEGSLAKDATRYRRIEEAICNDVELFEEVQELRRSIWGSGDGSAEG